MIASLRVSSFRNFPSPFPLSHNRGNTISHSIDRDLPYPTIIQELSPATSSLGGKRVSMNLTVSVINNQRLRGSTTHIDWESCGLSILRGRREPVSSFHVLSLDFLQWD